MSGNKQAIDELVKVFEKLQQKRDRLREQLSDADKECEAISSALKVLGHTSFDVNLKGMTQLDALIAIAKANNDELSVRVARRQMSRYGLFKNEGNASSIIHTTINRSGKFVRVKPGVYRLIDADIEALDKATTDEAINTLNGQPPLIVR